MRKIKFRARHSKTGEWWYGSSEVEYHPYKHYRVYALAEFWGFIRKGILDPKTVGQYIGLKKNGVEVYDGDVLSPVKRLEKYGNQLVQYQIEEGFSDAVTSSNLQLKECAGIIGNIFENPELKPD